MPKSNTHWPYPGKVLIVDDQFDEPIKTAVDQLLQNGVPVGYWDGRNPKTVLSNTRVVLLDLILRPDAANISGPEKFDGAIEALRRLRGASIVIIFSNTSDDPGDFAKAYGDKGGMFHGVIANEKMPKAKLTSPSELITLIENSVKEHPEVRLALSLESTIDSAKDGAFESTLGQNVDVVAALLKIVERQTGKEGLRKELVDTMIRILSRHAHSGAAYDELPKILNDMLAKTTDDLSDASLLSLFMYYHPQEGQLWTGDIFQTGKTDGRDIAIVLTPACDLVWSKPSFVTVAFGFSLTPEVCQNTKSILFQKDEKLREMASKPREMEKRIECYTVTGKSLPAWAFVLHHVNFGGKMGAVCLDLNDIERVSVKDLESKGSQWRRITRLDTPFVEWLLQKFGGHLSRIGVPDVNFSLQEFAKRAGEH